MEFRLTTTGRAAAVRAAQVTLGSGDAGVQVTAAAPGTAGNAIAIALVDPGSASQSLSVAVAGTAITVTLATDAASAVTTTAAELVAALTGDTSAADLVVAALAAGSNGTGVVAASAATALSGGGAATLRLTRLAIGAGRGPGGAADDGRIALRAERDSAAVAGQTSARPAAAVLGDDDAAVTITAAAPGTAGNAITIALVDPGSASQSLSVAVAGTAITVTLATDAAAAIATTGAELVAALTADGAVTALVTSALAAESNGTGVVAAAAATTLDGGRSAALVAVRACVEPTGDYGVVEAGLFGRSDGGGSELLLAYWTHPSAVLAPARRGVPMVIGTVVDGRTIDAAVTVASADVAWDPPVAFVDLADTPARYDGHAREFLQRPDAGEGIEFAPATAVAAWLPPPRVVSSIHAGLPGRVVGPDYPCRWLVVAIGAGGGGAYGDNPPRSNPPLRTPPGGASVVAAGGRPVVRAAGGRPGGSPGAGPSGSSIGSVVVARGGAAGGRGYIEGEAGDLAISLIEPIPRQPYSLHAGAAGPAPSDWGGYYGVAGSILIIELRR